jgi:uncharacterized protein (DUF58 family)
MKQDTREVIQSIMARVVSTPIPVRWRSEEIMPGGGDRRSFSRGSNGHDIQARVEYEPGDDPRDIDWAATAQTGGQTMYITQYMEPRDLKVFILADVGPTMDFGTHRTTKRVLSGELIASVIKSAVKTHDRVGFTAYGEHNVVATRRTMAAQSALFPAIASLIEADGSRAGEGSGLRKAIASLPRQRSLVFIVSDFLNLNETEKRALKRAALAHDVVCVLVNDLREIELPAGWGLYTLSDLRTGIRRSVWLTDRRRTRFAQASLRRQEELFAFFQEAHCDYAAFHTAEGEAALKRIMRLFGGHRK